MSDDDVGTYIYALRRGTHHLPRWLALERGKGPSALAILHGTPDISDIGLLILEVWSVRKGSSHELIKTLMIKITEPPGQIYNAIKFPVVGSSVYELFKSGQIHAFKSLSRRVFGRNALLLRVDKLHKSNGTEVTISPGHEVLSLSEKARVEVDKAIGCCRKQEKQSHSDLAKLFAVAGFDIDWCNVVQVVEPQGLFRSLRRRSALSFQTSAATGNDSFITPPPYEGSNVPLIVMVIVAAVVALLATTSIAWVFFGGRRGGFYISHKRAIEQRILREKDKQTASNVAKAQRVLAADLNKPREAPSHPVPVRPPNEEVIEDAESIRSLTAEPLPPYQYPRDLLRCPLTVTPV